MKRHCCNKNWLSANLQRPQTTFSNELTSSQLAAFKNDEYKYVLEVNNENVDFPGYNFENVGIFVAYVDLRFDWGGLSSQRFEIEKHKRWNRG